MNATISGDNKEDMVQLLVAAKSFREAFDLWKGGGPSEGLVNGKFEDAIVLDDCCFHWVISERQGKAKFALDLAEKFSGQKSLQITFDGDWESGAPVLSQTIVLEPGERYRLNYAMKTKDLVTGGPLRIVLTDATNDKILAQSETFPQSTGSWQQLNVEFAAAAEAAVNVSLKREKCASSPCPIFGTVWLDEFWFQKL